MLVAGDTRLENLGNCDETRYGKSWKCFELFEKKINGNVPGMVHCRKSVVRKGKKHLSNSTVFSVYFVQ